MAILHGKESVPEVGDVVVKTTVELYFSELSFKYDFEIKFKSGKTNSLAGWYGDSRNNDGRYEKFSKLLNNIDLEKYKDTNHENRYLIPLSVFSCAVGDF